MTNTESAFSPVLSPEILKRFSSVRLLVVGDVMLDTYWQGDAQRISPEAPVPVVRIKHQHALPGGAANVARNAATLGASVTLVGRIGTDPEGRTLQALLEAQHVRCALVKTKGAVTTTKLRVMAQHQQLIRLDFEESVAHLEGEQASDRRIYAQYTRALSDARWVILSDYNKGVVRHVQSFIKEAKKQGVPVIVDPKGVDFERYRGALLLKPNLAEFEAVAGVSGSEADLAARGEKLRSHLDLHALLITRGHKGMTLVRESSRPLHLAAKSHDVYDVTGAGDTVIAALAVALGAGATLNDAAVFANRAAGIVVTRAGAATVTLAEMLKSIEEPPGQTPQRGVVSEEELLRLVAQARAKGERLVMTNGCFDLLHPGHVDYLERARVLGHRLIVAVNDDASVRRLKGGMRPVNQLAVRMRMLAALESVDWVVPFSDDTPQQLYGKVLPDILVKGSDYRDKPIAGAREVEAAGGKVELIALSEGYSTTALISRVVAATTSPY